MEQSSAMLEIRKIRDENSKRHLDMTTEERRRSADEALNWLSLALKNSIKAAADKKVL